MSLTWKSIGTDEPLDQEADLSGPYWAEIGPGFVDSNTDWSWSIHTPSPDDWTGDYAPIVDEGRATDEAQAKAAVQSWAWLHSAPGNTA